VAMSGAVMVVAAVATGEGVAAAATAEAGRSDPYQVCNNFLAKADLHIIPGTGTLPIVFYTVPVPVVITSSWYRKFLG